jgi:Uma2 family endonuclease
MLEYMGAKAGISVDGYLQSSLPDLDRGYRDGELVERSLPDQPPFIAVEILSPDDRLNAVREKLEEHKSWGVQHVWLVDPHSRRMYTCEAGLTEVPSLRIPELDVEVTPSEIFE